MNHGVRLQGAPRLHGLDGLRGLAITLVVLYHLDVPGVADAGFLGVDIFFTISGFIITALLVREWLITGDVRLGAFYVRRTRRLLPAALALIAIGVPVTSAIAPDALRRLLSDIPAALLYASNWWQLHSRQSYFESFGRPPVLQHLWSLAVEEQFYIAWPPLLLLLLRSGAVGFAASVACTLALASAAWMARLHGAEGAGPDRAYLGSDTHAAGLLVGAAVACMAARWRLLSRTSPLAHVHRVVQAAGAAALGGLVALGWLCNAATPLLFEGGFLLTSVLSAMVLLAVTDGTGWLCRIMKAAPLQWLGTRSYSLYLWHWPVCVWLRVLPDGDYGSVQLTAGKIALTAIAGEISYRLLERPWTIELRRRVSLALPAIVGVALALVTVPVANVSPVPIVVALASGAVSSPQASVDVPPAPVDESPTPSVESPQAVAETAPSQPASSASPGVLVIGDSVMLGARNYLESALPGSRVDAAVGRQFAEGLQLVTRLRAQSALPPVVVLHLGTNGYITESHLRAMLQVLRDRQRVVLVDVHAKRRWTAANNEMIVRVGTASPNVVIASWDGASHDQPQYFVQDGIHLTSEGMGAVTREVARAAGIEMTVVNAPAHAHPPAAIALARKTADEAALLAADVHPVTASVQERSPASDMAAPEPVALPDPVAP